MKFDRCGDCGKLLQQPGDPDSWWWDFDESTWIGYCVPCGMRRGLHSNPRDPQTLFDNYGRLHQDLVTEVPHAW